MKIKNLNKKIAAILLSSTFFILASIPMYSSFAEGEVSPKAPILDTSTTGDDQGIGDNTDEENPNTGDKSEDDNIANGISVKANAGYDTKVKMPKSKTLTVNVSTPFSGEGYLMIDLSEKAFNNNKDKEPLTVTLNGSKTYLLKNYGRYSVGYSSDKTMYRYYIPCENLESDIQLSIEDSNKDAVYTDEFNMRIYAGLMGENTMRPTPKLDSDQINLGDILGENKIYATSTYEDEKKYEGFILGNLNNEEVDSFIFRPDARSARITLKIGAMSDRSFYYDNSRKNDKFVIKYYNTEDTFKKVKRNGDKDKDGKSKFKDDEYVKKEISVRNSNSVSLPWFPDHGIIEITLKQPNNFLQRISVVEERDSINLPDGNTDKPDTDKPDTDKPIDSKVTRYSDGNRYSTAIKLSKKAYDKSDIAVVASGENFADALSGGALAAIHEAPLLLVSEGSTADDVKAELDRLKVDKLYILGGTKSISNKIEFKLSKNKDDKNREVIRLSGSDRYKTSMEVYKEVTRASGSNEAPVLVNGKQFADALSAGPIAAKDKRAIVLTDGHNVDSRIDKKSDKNIIVGGYTSMDNSFAGYRYYGRDRYETSAKIAKHFNSPKNALLASGEKYPDGLAAITLYNKYEGPLLLTRKDSLPKDIKSYISSSDIENVYIIGGTSSVSEKVENTFKK